jgi:hypothetical protein
LFNLGTNGTVLLRYSQIVLHHFRRCYKVAPLGPTIAAACTMCWHITFAGRTNKSDDSSERTCSNNLGMNGPKNRRQAFITIEET